MLKRLIESLPKCSSGTEKTIRLLCTVAGILCLLYYVLVGFVAGLILTSILYIWILFGIVFFALALWIPTIAALIKRSKKWIVALIALLPILGLLLFTIGEISILTGFSSDLPNGSADYIIILGAKVNPNGPSLLLQRRIDAAYEYLITNPQTVAIASGGQGADEPMSEARCIADELIKRGIDADRILLEEASTDTAENIRYCRELFADSPDCTVLIVSNGFHCFRASAIAEKYLEAEVGHLAADSILFLLPHYMVREFIGLTVDYLQGNLAFE